MKKNTFIILPIIGVLFLLGCAPVPHFPQRPSRIEITSDGSKVLAFDTNRDRQVDYWQRQDATGRKVELRFGAEDDRPGQTVFLSEIDADQVPHFIIALDGVPYTLVEELYGEGCFRLFHPPARAISTFPGMTDLAFQRIFGGQTPIAYQAKHFDREKNKLLSGNDLYLSGGAADWSKKLDYRCSFKLDALAYINPQFVFEHELRGITDVFGEAETGTQIGYIVATAGLGTRGGREAILNYLRTIDRLCEQIVFERRGRVHFTLLADHGHNMSGRGRVSFDELLEEHGYRLTHRIKHQNEVVTVQYGLVTYAAFFSDQPDKVAAILLKDPVTTLACYPQNETVIVRSLEGCARIHRRDRDFRYEIQTGDPLQLGPIIDHLQEQGHVDADGFIDDRALLGATATHLYPDPLRRIWLAFHGLVQKPADLIVCLKDGWFHGSKFFEVMIGGASSTHGSLNQINSMTFAMTTLGPLPEIMRLEDIMPALDQLRQP